jgi:hypothetical protein
MLGYVGDSEAARKQHQQRLNEPPTVGVRDWRSEMSSGDREAFEHVAGNMLAELGYETSVRGRGRVRRARYRAQTAAWRAMGVVIQRSPLWSRRHPVLAKNGV